MIIRLKNPPLAGLLLATAALLLVGCGGATRPQSESTPSAAGPPVAAAPEVAAEPAPATSEAPESAGPTTAQAEVAIIAGGCFWGMEELLRKIDGVIDTEVGYCGGENANATYRNHAGHAEAVRVVFNPAKITFKRLLTDWFFRMHDPTTLNRQGNDRGTSYRSTIFYADDRQKATALEAIKEVNATGRWKAPIVTTVEPVKNWSSGEEYHQDYLQKNPRGYTCHWLRKWDDTSGLKKGYDLK